MDKKWEDGLLDGVRDVEFVAGTTDKTTLNKYTKTRTIESNF